MWPSVSGSSAVVTNITKPGAYAMSVNPSAAEAYVTSPRMKKAVNDRLAEAAEELDALSKSIGDIGSLTDDVLRKILDDQTLKIMASRATAPTMTL